MSEDTPAAAAETIRVDQGWGVQSVAAAHFQVDAFGGLALINEAKATLYLAPAHQWVSAVRAGSLATEPAPGVVTVGTRGLNVLHIKATEAQETEYGLEVRDGTTVVAIVAPQSWTHVAYGTCLTD